MVPTLMRITSISVPTRFYKPVHFVSYMVINKLLKLASYVTEHFQFGGLVDVSIVGSVVKPGVRPSFIILMTVIMEIIGTG
jgi:hypothetical protein